MQTFADVPQQLKDTPHWIVWRREVRKERETKVPYDANHPKRMAASNDSATWATFEKASAVANDPLDTFDGVGFMLQGTNIVGVDFDGVIDEAGTADPYALKIIEQLGNPYTEITPSGTGLRCFVESDKLPPGKRKFSDGGDAHHGVEIYIGVEGGRYLTVTGDKFGGNGVPRIEDLEIPYFLISQFRNNKLKSLWCGDLSNYQNDGSRADLALCDELVKLLGKDPMKVERYFNASGLCDEKWTSRPEYREWTISKALGVKSANDDAPQVSTNADKKAKKLAEELIPAEAQFRTGVDIVLKRIDWFWKDRIPMGKITLFAGNPDNGKSLVSTWVAATTTTGAKFPDCANHTPASEVLMLVGEDDIEDTVGPRLKIAKADMSKIHFMEVMRLPDGEEREVRLDRDLKALEKKLGENPEIRLVVIDPISNYLGDVSMVAEQEARSILIPLKRIAAEKNVAVIIVMHLNKKNELEAISRVGGAMAFIGVARASWLFIRDADEDEEGEQAKEKKDTFSMLRIKNNLARADKNGLSYEIKAEKLPELNPPDALEANWTPYVVWGESVAQSADSRLAKHGDRGRGRPAGVTTDKQQRAMSWLQDFLQGGARPAGEVLTAGIAAGHSDKMLYAVFDQMGGKKTRPQGKAHWELLPLNETKSDDYPTEVPPEQSELEIQ